jgi:hypothetical protein
MLLSELRYKLMRYIADERALQSQLDMLTGAGILVNLGATKDGKDKTYVLAKEPF